MKRKLITTFILILAFALGFAITAFAEEDATTNIEKYYLVQSADSDLANSLKVEGKKIVAADELIGDTLGTTTSKFFSQFADGSHIELNLAENIVNVTEEGQGILISTAITVTIKYNGFTHAFNTNKLRYNGFVLKNPKATIRLIGSKMEELSDTPTFVKPIISNGVITNSTECNLDVYHSGKVYVWIYDGSAYVENVRSHTGEEIVYVETETGDSSTNCTFEFINCEISSDSAGIGLLGKAASKKTVMIDNCYVDGLLAYTVLTGSYVKNSTIVGKGVSMDCWDVENQLWVFENCSINKISTISGRTDFLFKDCDFNIENASLGSDGGGKTILAIVKTASCETDTQVSIRIGTTTYTYEEYLANPTGLKTKGYSGALATTHIIEIVKALGHKANGDAIAVDYRYGFGAVGFYSFCCANCEKEYIESVGTAPVIFKTLGYSYKENGYGFASGYEINYEALYIYESLTGTDVEFGIVMFNPTYQTGETFFTNGNITVANNALQIKIDKFSYKTIGFMLKDFSNLDLELVIAIYANVITTDGEEVSYETSFVQSTTNTLGESVVKSTITKGEVALVTVSYNSIFGKESEE